MSFSDSSTESKFRQLTTDPYTPAPAYSSFFVSTRFFILSVFSLYSEMLIKKINLAKGILI